MPETLYETLLVSQPEPHLEVLTLNRPTSMNALSTQMARELISYFESFDASRTPDPRCLILTGAGNRAFCAGADLKERQKMDEKHWRAHHLLLETAGERLMNFPLPVIAAVNGAALGGGCEIAMACDLIIASDSAFFGQPEVKRGITPGMGGTQRLARRIGLGRAKELIFTGRPFTAREAQGWGLVNRVVSADQLMEEALALGREITANGPIAVRMAKRAIDKGADRPLPEALKIEIEAYNETIPTEDRREGIAAFNEKRPPRFQNR